MENYYVCWTPEHLEIALDYYRALKPGTHPDHDMIKSFQKRLYQEHPDLYWVVLITVHATYLARSCQIDEMFLNVDPPDSDDWTSQEYDVNGIKLAIGLKPARRR